MQLFWSPRSPFCRKVVVTAHECGCGERLIVEPTLTGSATLNAALMAHNPTNRIPTLVLGDGSALYDSRVICEYLITTTGMSSLLPMDTAARWTALRWQALGDGIMENNVLRLAEAARPADLRSPRHGDAYAAKTAATLDQLETEGEALPASTLNLGHLAIGCALAHLDFRFAADGWRHGHPRLARWFEDIARRPSFRATEYSDDR